MRARVCGRCEMTYSFSELTPIARVKCPRCGWNQERTVATTASAEPLPAPRPSLPAPKDDFEALLARVSDDPSRPLDEFVVLSDMLLEREDPRGTLMTLQLDEERSKRRDPLRTSRINTLLDANRAVWVPAGVASPVFQRGFLRTVSWQGATDPTHAGWRTVTSLRHALSFVPSPSYFDFARPNLRELTGVPSVFLRGLAAATLPALEVLELDPYRRYAPTREEGDEERAWAEPGNVLVSPWNPIPTDELARVVPRFPKLKTVRLLGPCNADVLPALLPSLANLEVLRVACDERLPRLRELLTRCAPKLRLETEVFVRGQSAVLDVKTATVRLSSGITDVTGAVRELSLKHGEVIRPVK